MPLMDFTDAFTGGPSFYSGTGTSSLVPDVFPVAINGRPYMIDRKSQQFVREFEPRVRDSSDDSTSPGEAAISTEGLWRRGQKSWHFGAGQFYADDAEASDYRFYKSKGVNPWVKGRLTLLNDTKVSLASSNTNLFTCTVRSGGTEYVYVADGGVLRWSSNPTAASPTWTAVTTATSGTLPTTAITSIESNGTNVFIAWTGNDIWFTTPGSTSATFFYPTSGTDDQTYTAFSYAKQRGWAAIGNALYNIPIGSSSHGAYYTNPDTTFQWVGVAAGQGAAYAAGYSGDKSAVYKIGITDAGVLDVVPSVALELPVGEVISSIHGYLGVILIGTNKGVRYCTVDSGLNLVAGAIIPTSGSVLDFVGDDRYVWFTWSNYDGVSTGLGRLDMSRFIATNTPAFATDLMYGSNADVKGVTSIGGRRIFTVAGVGVIAENPDALVPSGNIETGNFTWDIVDPKFSPRFDIRVTPLVGSVSVAVALDNQDYEPIGVHSDPGDTEHAYIAPETNFIEAAYKITLTRATTSTGPTFTRWMARAYAAPKRSRIITLPLLIHEHMSIHGRDYYFDVTLERDELEALADNPRIVTYQEQGHTLSVIVENTQFQANFSSGDDWLWEGTMIVQMRTVTE